MANTLFRAGDIDVQSIAIGTNKGWADLRHMYSAVHLYEDLFSPTLTGSVMIVDTQGLLTTLPIIGGEYIKLKFRTPMMPEQSTINQVFVITKIQDKMILDPHKITYTLTFTSVETYLDAGLKISKKYNGTADKVIDQILRKDLLTKKNFFVEEAGNNISFVSPYYSPFQIIQYYTAHSVSGKNNAPNFMFYEDNQSYKFVTMDTLFAAKAKVNYWYDNDPARKASPNGGNLSVEDQYTMVLDLVFDDHFNEFNRIDAGLHRNKTIVHDLVTKQTKAIEYNYINSFKKGIGHLGDKPLIVDSADSHRIVTHQITCNRIHDSMIQDYSGYAVNMRTPLLYDLDFLKVDIEVHGRTDLTVGDIVNFKLGDYRQEDDKSIKDPSKIKDEYINGKFIITAIHHTFVENKHKMVMQLARNAAEKDVAAIQNDESLSKE